MWSSSHIHAPDDLTTKVATTSKQVERHRPMTVGQKGTKDAHPVMRRPVRPLQPPVFLIQSTISTPTGAFSLRHLCYPLSGPEGYSSSKRLGYFADKLTSSLSGTGKDTSSSLKSSLHPGQLLHPHSHSRVESSSIAAPSISSTMASSSTLTSANKAHASPSKVSCPTSSTNVKGYGT